jgi:hypothetical protein
VSEIVTQFLMTVLDPQGRPVNVGAGVDDRGRVVLIQAGCDPIPLPIRTVTQYLTKVREAIKEAARGQLD